MVWSKMKQQLESFLCPELVGRVEYRATSYRYLPDKVGQCYITVDKKDIFKMNNPSSLIRWYQTEQEIKYDPNTQIPVREDEIDKVRKDSGGKIPEERLEVIVKNYKISEYAKEMLVAQATLSKSDFYVTANKYLSDSIEENLNSKDILLNVFALVDRRVGKKRLLSLEMNMKLKHPIVQYFYELRRSTIR